MREVAARFGLLVHVSRDLSVRRSSCGHLETGGSVVVVIDQEHDGASGLATCTEAQRQQAMARFAILRPHLNEGVLLSEAARDAGLVGLIRAPRSDTGNRKLPGEL